MDSEQKPGPVRWVQFTTPVFVRVQPDEDGWGTDIPKVVVVIDPDAMDLARDHDGFGVYDEHFDRVSDRDVLFDGNLRGAVSVAEDRHRWPKEQLVSLDDGWAIGPDPRDDEGEYYLDDDELNARYPDPHSDPEDEDQ